MQPSPRVFQEGKVPGHPEFFCQNGNPFQPKAYRNLTFVHLPMEGQFCIQGKGVHQPPEILGIQEGQFQKVWVLDG